MDSRYQQYHNNYIPIGQPESTMILAHMNGRNETPANNTAATGHLVGLLSPDGNRFDFVLHTQGLENIISAHFHLGAAGTNGRVVKSINIDPRGLAIGSWTISDSQPLTRDLTYHLKAGTIYTDVHTSQYPDGEIRGQTNDVSQRQYLIFR